MIPDKEGRWEGKEGDARVKRGGQAVRGEQGRSDERRNGGMV